MRQDLMKPIVQDTVAKPQPGKQLALDEISLATIVEKKPPAKVVREYFQKLADKLSDD